jgi:hypothetical protein
MASAVRAEEPAMNPTVETHAVATGMVWYRRGRPCAPAAMIPILQSTRDDEQIRHA